MVIADKSDIADNSDIAHGACSQSIRLDKQTLVVDERNNFFPHFLGMLDLKTNWNTNSQILKRAELVPQGTYEVPFLYTSVQRTLF